MEQTHGIPENHYREAAEYIRARLSVAPTVGLVLGSGLGPLVDEIEGAQAIPYPEIPHWPPATVQGHAGKLVGGMLEGRPVLVMQGRLHYYEGYSLAQVTLPVRVMRAAGGLNRGFSVGDIMVIEDHIYPAGFSGMNPLYGPNLGMFGPRFPVHTHTYSRQLRALAHRVAAQHGITLREGVYVSLSGPTFETPAEVRLFRAWGGDAVGMSTAPEALVAYHAGMRVLGFSSITNISLDSTTAQQEVSHEDVLRAGRQIVPRLATLLRGVLRELPPLDPGEIENAPEHD